MKGQLIDIRVLHNQYKYGIIAINTTREGEREI